MENLNDFDIEKLKRLQYESQLDRFLKKDKVQLLFPNVRGASEELKNHIRILALDKIDKGLGVETLTRLKDICEYFISKKVTEENHMTMIRLVKSMINLLVMRNNLNR